MPGLVTMVAVAFAWDGYVLWCKTRGRDAETVSSALRRVRRHRVGRRLWATFEQHIGEL